MNKQEFDKNLTRIKTQLEDKQENRTKNFISKVVQESLMEDLGLPDAIGFDDDTTVYFEWIREDDGRFMLFFENGMASYLRTTGSNIHSDMEEGIAYLEESIKNQKKAINNGIDDLGWLLKEVNRTERITLLAFIGILVCMIIILVAVAL